MPITEIGKIQVRRGKANTDTGIPQLSSGELCWAIDKQELFIGNGSVAEGSPFVGNTRILTEKDLNGFESSRSKSTFLSTGANDLIIKLPLLQSFDGSLVQLFTYNIPYQCVSTVNNFSIQGEFSIYVDLNHNTIELYNNYTSGTIDPINDGILSFDAVFLDQYGQLYIDAPNIIISGIGITYTTDQIPNINSWLTYYLRSDNQTNNPMLNNTGYTFGTNYRQSPDGWLTNFGNTTGFIINPNAVKLIPVAFQRPFIFTPYHVSATPVNVTGDNSFSVAINNITTTGMVLRCYSSSLTNETMSVNWLAQGI